MSFVVRRTDGTTLVEIADQTINTTDTSLALVGRGAVRYGQHFAENFVKLAENFSSSTSPLRPLVGQTWYDTATASLKVFDGVNWRKVGGFSGVGPGVVAGGNTLGGNVATGNRAAGAIGIILTNGIANTTVTVLIGEGRIIAAVSPETIAYGVLPTEVTIESTVYPFAIRFPNGIKAGITLATDSANYVFTGTATSAQYA